MAGHLAAQEGGLGPLLVADVVADDGRGSAAPRRAALCRVRPARTAGGSGRVRPPWPQHRMRLGRAEHPGAGLGPCSRHPKSSSSSSPCSTPPWRRRGRTCAAIISDERRLSARDLVDRLQGMRLLVLATVTADGRPLAGPVDGYFLHGTFWFSSGSSLGPHAPPGGPSRRQRDPSARRGPGGDRARTGRALRHPTTRRSPSSVRPCSTSTCPSRGPRSRSGSTTRTPWGADRAGEDVHLPPGGVIHPAA